MFGVMVLSSTVAGIKPRKGRVFVKRTFSWRGKSIATNYMESYWIMHKDKNK